MLFGEVQQSVVNEIILSISANSALFDDFMEVYKDITFRLRVEAEIKSASLQRRKNGFLKYSFSTTLNGIEFLIKLSSKAYWKASFVQ